MTSGIISVLRKIIPGVIFSLEPPMTRLRPSLVPPVAALMFVLALAPAGAQDRLSAMPGYDQFSKMSPRAHQDKGTVVSTMGEDFIEERPAV